MRGYYGAIDRKVFGGAWSLLSPALKSDLGGYSRWYAGYAYTESNEIEAINGVATGPNTVTVSVRLTATDRDACGELVTQQFAGAWTVIREGSAWQATAIQLNKAAGDSPIRDVRLCGPIQSPSSPGQICYPPIVLPAVDYPEQVIGDTVIPAIHIPAKTLAPSCFDTDPNFAPSVTSVWDGDYTALDPTFSPDLSTSYWDLFPAASLPDPTAASFGEFNDAGFPKNQYVRPYVRRDGTSVSGYWRNSPTDGLPTCEIISC